MLTVSIVTPTFNSMRTLGEYMDAILAQDWPAEALELVVADGGSTDGTTEALADYARRCAFPIRVLPNPLRTAEAGKAVGVRAAAGDVVLLLDSDNILPASDWLRRMTAPFREREIVASEPISYTWRAGDSVINRYCALLGMNDPLCLFTGNYDRLCGVTGRWTRLPREETDRGDYLSIRFAGMIPTMGANGFLMRRAALLENFSGDYLFDIDVLWELMGKDPKLRVAKVKTGVVHLYCPDLATFRRKQRRRVKDYLYFRDAKGRSYPWSGLGKGGIVLFCLSCVTILPLLIQALLGLARTRRDAAAWVFHLPACYVTLWVYGWGVLGALLGKKEAADRDHWKQ